jgi:hypothetical protein
MCILETNHSSLNLEFLQNVRRRKMPNTTMTKRRPMLTFRQSFERAMDSRRK